MLLLGQVPLLFDLENVGVVVVHGAGGVSLHAFPRSREHGSRYVPGVESCSNTAVNERAFEN